MESKIGPRARVASRPGAGEMSEWLKEHAWKACMRKRIEGSNPSLSASFSSFRDLLAFARASLAATENRLVCVRICFGDVAQLGERLVRNEEVSGSIPLISTFFFPSRA